MFRNFLLLAFRHLRRAPGTSLVNLSGLSAAFLSILVIFLIVRREWGADQFHENGQQVYRVTFDETKGRPDGRQLATTSPPMGPALEREYPEVVASCRLRYSDEAILSYNNQQYYENNLVYAGPAFFQLFSFPLVKGDPETALSQPNTVVLTPAMARKYFGEEDPMGKILEFGQDRQLRVTGVLARKPERSHLDFDFLVSFETFQVPPGYPVTLESWGWISFHTYVLLEKNAGPAVLEPKLNGFLADHFDEERAARVRLRLQPLRDIYFHSGHLMNTQENRHGNLYYTYGLSAIALLILLVAGFNFLNLATARSLRRAKEVGLRKVLGATSGQVRRQFLAEAFLLTALAFMVSVVLLVVLQSPIAVLLGHSAGLHWQDLRWLAPAFLLLSGLVALGAGFYPALVMSRYKAADTLKGQFPNSGTGSRLRTLLVGLQFAITTGLIIGSFAIYRQMEYIRQRDLGFDREQVVALQLYTPDFMQRFERARQVLAANPRVESVTAGDVFNNDYGSVPIRQPNEQAEEARAMHIFGIYFDYCDVLGIDVLEGRGFSRSFPQDTATGIILNETAARTFGWDEPLGQRLQVSDIMEGQVVGVVKDFHFNSLHEPMKPLVLFAPRTIMSNIIVRLRPGDVAESIASLERDWAAIAPDMPFQLSFIDEQVGRLYEADRRFSRFFLFFTLLSVILATTGLYSLVRAIVSYRMREVGIRKVLGASLPQLLSLLVGQFLWLALLAGMAALPFSWWLANRWLQQFAYRVEPGAGVFILALLASLALVALSVAREALWAARRKPAEVLRAD
ncbi:MAG: ABC transporter permease [Lewinellaceae bacterium]|nr:ABC transporter permease [Lewinellaceae bacterium]